ncbi:MAG: DnaJ domain-containing protein [Cyclobacteriaceae bacterium]|nr:DnaJ domain-containing protein [Cyclobacteriaceae bacterium]
MKDYYAILGIPSTATSGQIKLAYRRLALQFHPDRNKEVTEDRFIEISEAYHVLSSQHRRQLYDLGQYVPEDDQEEIKNSRRRPPPHYYYNQTIEKPSYSRKVYILSSVLVVAMIIFAVTVPVLMLRSVSNKYYNLAVQNYFAGRYYTALQNIDLSIRDVGGNNASACALASIILVYKIQNYDFAIRYIERGLGYTSDDSLRSEFKYLKGVCKAHSPEPDEALELYKQVGNYSDTYDSARLRMAAIYLRNGETLVAEEILDSLRIRNPQHWAAYYLQGVAFEQREEPQKAYELFSELLDKPYNKAAVYYHLAKSEISLNMADSACSHLKIASSMNLQEAKQLRLIYCASESIFLSPYH